MASSPENLSMALFCDFENVALGVRDTKFDKFDIKPVLERLLLKGSIVVKKAYCDWDRYKGFKSTMHEANFELIEIPHVRQSGKNSADIRLVVDALDLCYTKAHINTFVIISGDSDFSPLVSKLRENNKQVIGVGVKQSTSDLLIANCDEFIFYDDLVRESQHAADRRETREAHTAARRPSGEDKRRKDDLDTRKTRAVEIAVETFDALMAERGDSGKIWASVLKEAIKRRRPDFNESYFGFRAFGNLLEEAQSRGLLEFGRDEKSGAYVFRASASGAAGHDAASDQSDKTSHTGATGSQTDHDDHAQLGTGRADGSRTDSSRSDAPRSDRDKPESRRRSRGGRSASSRNADAQRANVAEQPHAGEHLQTDEQQPVNEQASPAPMPSRAPARGWQPPAAWDEPLDSDEMSQGTSQAPAVIAVTDDQQDASTPKPSRSRASRAGRTTRKPREAASEATATAASGTQLPGLDAPAPMSAPVPAPAPAQSDSTAEPLVQTAAPARTSGTRTASRRGSGRSASKTAAPTAVASTTDAAPATTVVATPVAAPALTPATAPDASAAKPARKTPARARRPRKTTAPDGE